MIHQFGLRSGSAGTGKWHGGEGVVREIEFLEGMQVSILSEVRVSISRHLSWSDSLRRPFFSCDLSETDKTAIWDGRWRARWAWAQYMD